jgi:hypothetical protein
LSSTVLSAKDAGAAHQFGDQGWILVAVYFGTATDVDSIDVGYGECRVDGGGCDAAGQEERLLD